MEKLTKQNAASLDIVAENIERMKELFPEVVAEDRVDFDTLRQVLGDAIEEREERYSLTWYGKSQARKLAQMPSIGTLRPCLEDSVDWETTKNIFIEGDNLEVLKLLQKSYHRKVKMIYIDPPYNTGKEFIYPDKYKDNLDTYLRYSGQINEEGFKLSTNTETSGRYHTNWLNMMFPRLRLARNLLRDDGLIFISIDDHEYHNLRHLLDELFGVENFQASIVVQSNKRGQTYKDIAKTHEYILVYGKSGLSHLQELPKEDGKMPYTDSIGGFEAWELRNRNPQFGRHNRPNLFFSIYADPDSCDELGFANVSLAKDEHHTVEIVPLNSEGEEGCWRWGRPKVQASQLAEVPDIVAKQRRDGGWNVYQKARKNTTKAKSLWTETQVISEQGTTRLRELGMGGEFDHPKPVDLIAKCIRIGCQDGDIILDFFAGSGTTGDAAITLARKEGPKTRYILVQLPHPIESSRFSTIADATKARLRSVTEKINNNEGGDLGFRAFQLAASNIKAWDAGFDTMEDNLIEAIDHIKSDRTEQDVLYELLLKYGLDLAIPIETRNIDDCSIYVIGAGALVVCLAQEINLDVVKGIAALKGELKPAVMRVVFRDSGFKDDVMKTNASQILRQAGIDDVKSL